MCIWCFLAGERTPYGWLLKIIYNLDASMAQHIGELAEDTPLDTFMVKFDFHYENWNRQLPNWPKAQRGR
ncbi:hypothetical protein N7465_002669 [Penicillium sp. CMV-2018d]|nr:hypothetical protein N7465_002669 [Penicillium sp. CMV-2018d]